MDYAKSGAQELGIVIECHEWVEGMECCYSLSKCIYSNAKEAEQESGASEIGYCRPVHICVGTCQSLCSYIWTGSYT